ncbi:AbiTii domain-containing protein [Marinobacter fonticola]|uniref:AbiTii domain-containing protein n=1 Tax=Marinobacter fonticola TaxID=2603215 RepID=UPI0011E6BD5D|nr:hypothetical protein [Marinobacter fonticola]
MESPVDDLEERLLDASDGLADIMPAAITLAMMFRHRAMAAWLRSEFDGYAEGGPLPPYRVHLAGHIVARSPQYGWIQAPIDQRQTQEYGHIDTFDGVKGLERTCLNCKKGGGHQVKFPDDVMAELQQHINLKADLALSISRETYSDLIRMIRSAIYLWVKELVALDLNGPHNSFSKDEREKAASLDSPDRFWRRAMEEVNDLPVPGVRSVGFLERVFGAAS